MPKIDIISRNFYWASQALLNQSADKENLKQRCIGNKMSHLYTLEFLKSITAQYDGAN